MEARTAKVASGQHGLITHGQARAAKLPVSAIRHRLETGRWVPEHMGVYAVAGSPRSWEQKVLAACLAAGTGAVASHRCAARLWALNANDDEVVEISVVRTVFYRLGGVIVHRSTDLHRSPATVRAGIPVTTPMRTLVDLGSVVAAPQVERALDDAVARRLVTLDGVRRELDTLARKGRRGAGVLRALLDARTGPDLLAPTVLESRMSRLCRDHGVAAPTFQFEVRNAGRFVGRVDFAYPALRLGIEVDGYEHHSTLAAFQHDRARQNDLVAAGWTVLRFTWDDVTRRPERVATAVERLLVALKAG